MALLLWITWAIWTLWCDKLAGRWMFARHRHVARHGHNKPAQCNGQRFTQKPDWVVAEVIRLKALSDASCRKLADLFSRLHLARRGMSVSPSYVAYTLRKHQYAVTVARRELKHRLPCAVAMNRVWGIDLTGKQDVRGAVHAILGVVDHGSRRSLVLAALPRKNAWTLLGHLFLAIGEYGKPWAVRSDNEAMFQSRLWRSVLTLFGIRIQYTTPGCPWQNGRIERFFGTLKEKLDRWQVASREELNAALNLFAFWYNRVRPHQHLQGRTPVEAWDNIDPFAVAPKSVQWFAAWDGLLAGYYLRR